MSNILERLQIPITEPSGIPDTFDALTFPIRMDEEEIIRSIWFTLRTTEALVTVDGRHVQFWRAVVKRSPSHDYKGFVKTAP
jgi:hypothetical protein